MTVTSDDPRRLPGSIEGPNDPHGRGTATINTTNAVLLDEIDVSTVDRGDGTPVAIALLLSGRINRTTDRAKVLFLFGSDGAAALITELVALSGRAGAPDADEFLAEMVERIQKLRDEGNLS